MGERRLFVFGGAKAAPTFQHNCDACIYCGSTHGKTGILDAYWCPRADAVGGGSVVLRFGDDVFNYFSSPVSIVLTNANSDCYEYRVAYDVVCELLSRGHVTFNVGELPEEW